MMLFSDKNITFLHLLSIEHFTNRAIRYPIITILEIKNYKQCKYFFQIFLLIWIIGHAFILPHSMYLNDILSR